MISAEAGQEQSQEQVESEDTEIISLELPAALTVQDLATAMDVGPVEVIKGLMRVGHMVTINEVIEHETAAAVASLFSYDVIPIASREDQSGSLVVSVAEEDPDKLEPRPPVVTILGHVDHGKTTLLDRIRSAKVAEGEAGNITQHIGAYQIQYQGNSVTFLDTPGHEAFTAIRARGAQVTDIAILVVAADDGIMPQTIEAIDHVRAANVPIVVAINKIDKPDADAEKVKRQLAEQNLLVEDWGGDVISVPVSGLTNSGVTELLENLLVVAEVSELKANPERSARGVIIEAKIDKNRGPVATVLIQTGTLNVGEIVVVGDVRGRVKAMVNDQGDRLRSAGPSQPVEILGLNGLPAAGETMVVASDDKTAKKLVTENLVKKEHQKQTIVSLEDVYTRIQSGDIKALNLIVKTDVQGSIDAVRQSLDKISTEQYKVNLIRLASGGITENDVLLAIASDAIVIGFNSKPEPGARALAHQTGIEIKNYDIIYNLIDDVQKALTGLLEPVYKDVLEGSATIRAVFSLSKRIKAAGIYVNDGRIARDSTIHILRDGERMFVGPITSLKHFKDDVREVTSGFEGGVAVEGFSDYQEDDMLEAYRSERVD